MHARFNNNVGSSNYYDMILLLYKNNYKFAHLLQSYFSKSAREESCGIVATQTAAISNKDLEQTIFTQLLEIYRGSSKYLEQVLLLCMSCTTLEVHWKQSWRYFFFISHVYLGHSLYNYVMET